jgi:hypothetical protein
MQSSAGECVVDNHITHVSRFLVRRGFSPSQTSEDGFSQGLSAEVLMG